TGSAYRANVDVNAVANAIGTASNAVAGDFELKLDESTVMRDGRHAHNAILQELPAPDSKVTWDKYAALNPRDAEKLGLGENGKITVEANGYALELPVVWQPGQAAGTVSIAVGYGRTKVGKAGNNVGQNAYPFARLVNGTVQFETKATV